MSWPSQSEEALLAGCSRNDSGAWNEFITRYSRLIYWAIGQILKDSRFGSRLDLTEDIFQDVFRKIFEKNTLTSLADPAHIKKYLVVLSTHLTLDRLKSISRWENKSVNTDDLVEGEAAQKSPQETVHQNELNAAVSEALDGLTSKEQACLELHVLDGMTHQEVGVVLELSQNTVSSIIRRAKDKVKEKLRKKGNF